MKFNLRLIRYKQTTLKLSGFTLVALGVVGMALPIMPTTIFFILALVCFSHQHMQSSYLTTLALD